MSQQTVTALRMTLNKIIEGNLSGPKALGIIDQHIADLEISIPQNDAVIALRITMNQIHNGSLSGQIVEIFDRYVTQLEEK